MSALEVRQVKRPRLSLSCSVCRSRKVRCGREQPECTNCLRMNKECVYTSLVRDELTGRLRQPSASDQDRDSARIDPDNTLNWSQANTFPQFGDSQPTPVHSDQYNIPTGINSSSDSNPPLPQEPQAQLSKTHPKVRTWEEAIQEPVNGDISGSGLLSTALPDQGLSSQGHRPDIISDYLSLRQGGRIRYIGRAFWGFIPGQESLSDDFFDKNSNAQPGLPLPHIAAADLANLLKSLPPKSVCDILLDNFFTMVWPLAPLVHPTTLQTDYDEFWDWCRNNDTALPPAKIVDNPTFVCLLFAILLCGASTVAAAMTKSHLLDILRMETQRIETVANRLEMAYMASLSMCRHLEHPTFNTLVSTLLTRPFVERPSEPMQNLLSLSTVIRLSQTMGLHCESTWSALDSVTREMRRRVWWHIVSLDVQSSISTGLPLCCTTTMQDTVSMITFMQNEEIGSTSLPPAESLTLGTSAAMIYTIGRYEAARLESKIITRLENAQGLDHEGFTELAAATKQLHRKLDGLIARLTTEGFPARGLIPPSWKKASPLTHPSLYKSDTTEPTVFAAWVRVSLTLLKFEVAILMQKPLLQTHKHEKPHELRTWISMMYLCSSYLHIYLSLHHIPAFAPYVWSYRTYFGPLQSTYILLTYLLRFRREPLNDHLVRPCVDGAIKMFMTQYQSMDSDSSLADDNPNTSETHLPVAIQVLVNLHQRLDSPTGNGEPTASTVDISDWRAISKGGIYRNVPDSSPDRAFISSLYDLQDSLVQLVQDSKCLWL